MSYGGVHRRELLPNSCGCFICGEANGGGVRTRFFVEDDAVCAEVVIPTHMNGYAGIAHGGVAAALVDESMGWAATVFCASRRMYLTGELTVRYLAPVPVGEPVFVRSRVVRDAGRVAFCAGEVTSGGNVCLRAEGKFLPLSAEETMKVVGYLRWDGVERYRTLFEEVS